MARTIVSACVSLLIVLAPATSARAATYGDAEDYEITLTSNCDDTIFGSLTVNVSISSRILVTARTSYFPGTTDTNQTNVWAELRDSADTTTLATTHVAHAVYVTPVTSEFVDGGGMLFAGTHPNYDLRSVYTVAPGTYTLKMHGQMTGGTCTGDAQFVGSVFGYILLSSVFDRVFGDGFGSTFGGAIASSLS